MRNAKHFKMHYLPFVHYTTHPLVTFEFTGNLLLFAKIFIRFGMQISRKSEMDGEWRERERWIVHYNCMADKCLHAFKNAGVQNPLTTCTECVSMHVLWEEDSSMLWGPCAAGKSRIGLEGGEMGVVSVSLKSVWLECPRSGVIQLYS